MIIIALCWCTALGADAIQLVNCPRNSNIIGNKIRDISGHAIQLGDINNPNPRIDKQIVTNLTISNNYIENIATEYWSCAALSGGYLQNTVISHNEISNTPYSGMHIGWGWGIPYSTATKNLIIENNYIHNVMNKLIDGGAVYLLGGTGGTKENPNIVRQNRLENQHECCAALYTDEGCSFYELSENVIDLSMNVDKPWSRNDLKNGRPFVHLLFYSHLKYEHKYILFYMIVIADL